eukprot:5934484-Amphidinium_carterae.1
MSGECEVIQHEATSKREAAQSTRRRWPSTRLSRNLRRGGLSPASVLGDCRHFRWLSTPMGRMLLLLRCCCCGS